MGQTSGNLKEINQQYEIIQDIQHPQFGEVEQIQDKETSALYFFKEFIFQENEEYQQKLNQLHDQFTQCQNQENILQIHEIFTDEDKKICSSFLTIYVIFESVNHDLKKEIDQRAEDGRIFKESELWNVARSVNNAMYYSEIKDRPMKNLQPSSVYINQDNNIKLVDQEFLNHDSNYEKVFFNRNPGQCYLSPTQVEHLNQQQLNFYENPHKSTVFTAGLTLVHASLLEDCEDLYITEEGFNKDHISSNLLNNKLDRVEALYSTEWRNYLQNMLQLEEHDRPMPSQLPVIPLPHETHESQHNHQYNDNQEQDKISYPKENYQQQYQLQQNALEGKFSSPAKPTRISNKKATEYSPELRKKVYYIPIENPEDPNEYKQISKEEFIQIQAYEQSIPK